jgi:hypothetical protein
VSPAAASPVAPVVEVSMPGVNVGALKTPGEGALLIQGKYTTSDTGALTLRGPWQHPHGHATAFTTSGELPLEFGGNTATVTVDSGPVAFAEFRPRPWAREDVTCHRPATCGAAARAAAAPGVARSASMARCAHGGTARSACASGVGTAEERAAASRKPPEAADPKPWTS